MSSNGKVALVTGSTGGIGFECAKKLGQDGFTVILNGLDNDAGAERLKELTETVVHLQTADSNTLKQFF